MTTLGIIGAENSHSHHIAHLCNVKKKVPLRVTHLWSETPELARSLAKKNAVPHVVSAWKAMAGAVDGVMIAHRHGRHHFAVARYFLERGIPTFVDKPLTDRVDTARRLLDLAARKSAPLWTGSAVPLQKCFRQFQGKIAAPIVVLASSGPADPRDAHGGLFFYGIHQADSIVELMGTEARSVEVVREGKSTIAVLRFSEGRLATMTCLPPGHTFQWQAYTEKQSFALAWRPDAEMHLSTARALHRLIRHGACPASPARMLAPVALIEAMQRAYRSGEKAAISRSSV